MTVLEKPPILRGTEREQIGALRDYLFRMAQSLETAAAAETVASAASVVKADGSRALKPGGANQQTVDDVRRNARELRDLILKSARDLEGQISAGDATVIQYVESKTEEYNSLYVAQSDFGTFTETIGSEIESTARGVVESYNYGSAIESMGAIVQNYFTQINGEIRRGIIEDPETHEYELGIAISQNLTFSGECGPDDANNPGDGYTYYYLNSGQTFGLYTSTGWQFWIDGYKRGWFNSEDGMLHVKQIVVEQSLQIGDSWQIITNASNALEIRYVGG